MAESWQVSPDNVMVTAFKRSDADPGAVLVRLLECEGTRCDVTLRVPFPFESAVAVDLLERPLDSLDSDGSSLRIALRPHQFQTVRLSLGHSAND